MRRDVHVRAHVSVCLVKPARVSTQAQARWLLTPRVRWCWQVASEPATPNSSASARGSSQATNAAVMLTPVKAKGPTLTRVYGPNKESFVTCDCGCGTSAPASSFYHGLTKCPKGGDTASPSSFLLSPHTRFQVSQVSTAVCVCVCLFVRTCMRACLCVRACTAGELPTQRLWDVWVSRGYRV